MDAIPIQDSQEPLRPALPVKAILGLIALAALTMFLTWRARVIEKTLQGQREEPTLVGKRAPDFSASTLDGRTVSLAEFRGQKKVVVSFWASWCGPCRLEMPGLIKFYKDHHDASSDFEILAVSIDENTKDAVDFAAAQKLNFPVLLDPRQKIADAYEVEGIPTMFIVDKDGKIISGQIGYDMTMEFRLAAMLGIKEKKRGGGGSDGGASD
jgi:peroxiredoxin